ncbi:unnamed protein product [Phytomonas sp. Hart1]|nr:unnamed protein product [Phytomonas sp. Hart1]|eukprot:CCW67410.1 unnamed protein product [Phytomonas sp. isolate Hart1]
MIPLLQYMGLVKKWPTFSADEVACHCTRESLWIVMRGSVYDVTSYLGSHPGGIETILKRGGGAKDCAVDMSFHSSRAQKLLESFKIGVIDPNTTPSRALYNLADGNTNTNCCVITRTPENTITEPQCIACIKGNHTRI